MDDIKILELLERNANSTNLAEFAKGIFISELDGLYKLYSWEKEYDKLLEEFVESEGDK